MKLLVTVVVRDKKKSSTTWWSDLIEVKSDFIQDDVARWILDKIKGYCSSSQYDYTTSISFIEVISISHSVVPN